MGRKMCYQCRKEILYTGNPNHQKAEVVLDGFYFHRFCGEIYLKEKYTVNELRERAEEHYRTKFLHDRAAHEKEQDERKNTAREKFQKGKCFQIHGCVVKVTEISLLGDYCALILVGGIESCEKSLDGIFHEHLNWNSVTTDYLDAPEITADYFNTKYLKMMERVKLWEIT